LSPIRISNLVREWTVNVADHSLSVTSSGYAKVTTNCAALIAEIVTEIPALDEYSPSAEVPNMSALTVALEVRTAVPYATVAAQALML